ncbi:hypothetical protein CR162_16490 [Pseudoroseomonas rhizosphaerae]|uniref:OmpR/PhoB-type domain-containing protein n=1 Tax=Teichococcus rhizosphaerae TaxID=1335062 RepID=A0A2C7A9Y6_9PROT|nr:hypothetical protein [Pseudoroseomonas rhizosphaerae]PHK93866.1 hypothetical protein CR162_16490 [Pseudoroseomonas rhizosphaerae]
MNESLPVLLLQRSEAGEPAYLLGVPELSPEGARAFERLLELGIVVHDRKLDVWDPCPDCDCGAEERRIRWKDGEPYAACPVSCAGDEHLDPEDLQIYRISAARLADQIASAAGVQGSAEQLQPGLFCIGALPGGRLLLLAMTVEVVRRPGVLEQIRVLARGQRISLVAPAMPPTERARLEERGVDVMPPAEAFLPSQPRQPVLVNLDALLIMPKSESRLVLSKATGAVTLDGHSAKLPPREFELLWLLCERARRGRLPVPPRDILDAMYRGTTATDATVRSLKRDLQNSLKDLLARARFPEPLILAPGGRGYALALGAEDILLIEA